MVSVYMVILCVSALLGGWAGMRVWRRLAPMTGLQPSAGWCALVPAIMFLIVVGAPAPVLFGALSMALLLIWKGDSWIATLLLALVAVLIGLMGIHAPLAAYASHFPPLAALALAGALWFGLVVASRFMSASAPLVSGGALMALAAVAAAPLLVAQTHMLTLDAAIIAAAFVGVLLAGGNYYTIATAPRMGIGFLIAYLQIAALWQGAWIAGGISMAVWLLAIGWSWMGQDEGGMHHG